MKLNNKRGISLIVLVITIAVMIILAAAIILSLQSSGIIGRANEAKTASDVANAKQVVAMANAEWKLDEEKIRKEDSSIQNFNDYANKKLTEAGFTTSGNGGISLSEGGAVNTIYVDSKGKQAIIPEGFVASQATGENMIENGLVIYEGTDSVTNSNVNSARETRNQFVWIPIDIPTGENFEDVFTRTENYSGTIVSPDSSYVEPVKTACVEMNLSEYTCSDTILLSEINDKTGAFAEYKAMYASVKKYGGFYIARYEAGTTVERKENQSNETTDLLIRKNKNPYVNVGWGPDMSEVSGNVIMPEDFNQGKGAVAMCRAMYSNSNSVVSTLSYSVQMDAAITFISTRGVADDTFATDATGKGHFHKDAEFNDLYETFNLIKTGSKEEYGLNNIYDIAGNAYEITMEGYASNNEIGVVNYSGGYMSSASNGVGRVGYRMTTSCDSYTGFRPSLYLK